MIYLIVPTYNEETIINKILINFNNLQNKLNQIKFKMLIVDDGSSDNTWEEILEINRKNKDIHAIKLIRNCGKEAAIQTAFEYVSDKNFDSIIVMDADLQHPFKTIEDFILHKNDYLIVQGIRSKTSTSKFRKMFTHIFYFLINSISLNKIIKNSTDFCLINKKAFNYVRKTNSGKFLLKQTLSTIINKKLIYFESPKRNNDFSKFHFRALLNLGLEFLTKNTNFPLKLIFYTAFISLVVSVTISLYFFLFSSGVRFTNITVIMIFFLNIIILIGLGFISIYILNINSNKSSGIDLIIDEI